jgi:hypothetical protein
MHHQVEYFNNCTLCPQCMYVFCVCLKTNSYLCHLQHKLIGFYNRDEKCLERGTDWVCKWSGLRLCHLQHKLIGFYNKMKSVYSAVRTGSLNKAHCACATYSINWLVFKTEMKRVYSAVRSAPRLLKVNRTHSVCKKHTELIVNRNYFPFIFGRYMVHILETSRSRLRLAVLFLSQSRQMKAHYRKIDD